VSAGSTPTATHSKNFAASPKCDPASIASTISTRRSSARAARATGALVLASVIGHYPHRNQVLIDAGALALSKDISAQESSPRSATARSPIRRRRICR